MRVIWYCRKGLISKILVATWIYEKEAFSSQTLILCNSINKAQANLSGGL